MRCLTLFLFILFLPNHLSSQSLWGTERDFRRIDLPFEYKNNLIIVNVTFNRVFPLKFIFDTGAENTILAKKEIADLLGIPYEREFKLMGSDMKTELTAYLIRNIHLRSGSLILPRHSMLVLDDDYFRFEEVAGLSVHGILGADVFRSLVVKINYERKIITLTKRQYFKPPSDFESIPIDVYRSKPYLNTALHILRDSTVKVKLLLDSGAMVALIVNVSTHPKLHLPPHVLAGKLGAGLGGFLEGYIGRVSSLDLGERKIKEVLTHYQDLSEAIDTSILNGRNGIIGSQILNRFHVIIDYPKETLYLKPNKKFKKEFEYDKSGLVIIAADARLNSFIVHEVIAGSPAAEAGVLPNDRILKINGLPPSMLSLPNINKMLRKKEGKRIKLRIKRGKEKMTFVFRLRKLI